jgi:hypothetical protein
MSMKVVIVVIRGQSPSSAAALFRYRSPSRM